MMTVSCTSKTTDTLPQLQLKRIELILVLLFELRFIGFTHSVAVVCWWVLAAQPERQCISTQVCERSSSL